MRIPPCGEGVLTADIDKMKAHELLSSPDTWCQEALAKDGRGDNVPPFDPEAVQWCALAAVQTVYPLSQWEGPMNRVLHALAFPKKELSSLANLTMPVASWNGTISGNRPIRKFERFCLRRTSDGPCGRGRALFLNLQKTDFSKCQIEKN
jgi:hypothetical protein